MATDFTSFALDPTALDSEHFNDTFEVLEVEDHESEHSIWTVSGRYI